MRLACLLLVQAAHAGDAALVQLLDAGALATAADLYHANSVFDEPCDRSLASIALRGAPPVAAQGERRRALEAKRIKAHAPT